MPACYPWWRVTFSRMAVRASPSTSANSIAVLYKGAIVNAGKIILDSDGAQWLQLTQEDSALLKPATKKAPVVADAWMLIDASAAGLGSGSLLEQAPPLKETVGGDNIQVLHWQIGLHPQSRGRERNVPRFCVAPVKSGWAGRLGNLGIGFSSVQWDGKSSALPTPPAKGCWLIPANHHVALGIARHAAKLHESGWKVALYPSCTSGPEDVRMVVELADKAALQGRAKRLGVLSALPTFFASPDQATYPCILKAADGEHGTQVHLVRSRGEAMDILNRFQPSPTAPPVTGRLTASEEPPPSTRDVDTAPSRLRSTHTPLAALNEAGRWVLQELIPGPVEYATSLVLRRGRVVDLVATRYTYEQSEYVWPRVKEVPNSRVNLETVPAAHLNIMQRLLDGFTGVCNLNYKIRSGGTGRDEEKGWGSLSPASSPFSSNTGLCIFEVNPRLGADLACDVGLHRARDLWERFDGRKAPRPYEEMSH